MSDLREEGQAGTFPSRRAPRLVGSGQRWGDGPKAPCLSQPRGPSLRCSPWGPRIESPFVWCLAAVAFGDGMNWAGGDGQGKKPGPESSPPSPCKLIFLGRPSAHLLSGWLLTPMRGHTVLLHAPTTPLLEWRLHVHPPCWDISPSLALSPAPGTLPGHIRGAQGMRGGFS